MTGETIELIRRVNPLPIELPAPPIEPLLQRLDDVPAASRTPAARPRRRALGLDVVGVLVAGAIAAATAVVAIVALGHEPRRQAVAPSRVLPAAQTQGLTAILGVLRRPQTAADRNPSLIAQLQREQRSKYNLAFEGRPVLSMMRLATVAPWGAPVFLVPFLAPTKQAKARLPRKLRSVTVPTQANVWTFSINGGSGGQGIPADIEGGRDITNMAWVHGATRGPAANRWVMVVPDGVAKVALWETTGSASAHPRHPIKPGSEPIIVAVHHNIAAFIAHGFDGPGQEIWYGPDGTVVKRITNADPCAPPLTSCA